LLKKFLTIVVIATMAGSFNLSASTNICSNTQLLNTYKKTYSQSKSANNAIRAVGSTLSDFYKADAALSRFIINAANGELIKEINTVTAVTQGYKIHPITLKSSNLVDFYHGVELRGQPMASYLTEGFDRLGMLVSIINFADKLQIAIATGDKFANANAAKDAIDIGTAISLSYKGWQGVKIAFSAVGFIDYALNSFINDAYGMYDEYWWQSYRSYLDAEYPKMVTGSNSWAALAMRNDKGRAFQARLDEFWSNKGLGNDIQISTPMERAAHFYKKPSLINGSALAESMDKYKKSFASRYYNNVLKITLNTYFQNQAAQLEFDAEYKLEQSLDALCAYKVEIKNLQLKVAELQKKQKQEKLAKEKENEKTESGLDKILSPLDELLGAVGLKSDETLDDGIEIVETAEKLVESSDNGETDQPQDDIEDDFGDVDEVAMDENDDSWEVRQQIAEDAELQALQEENVVAQQQQQIKDERARDRAEFAAGMQVIAQGLGEIAVKAQQSNMELDQQIAANNANFSKILNSGGNSKHLIDACVQQNRSGRYSDINAIRNRCAQQVSSSLNNQSNPTGRNNNTNHPSNTNRRKTVHQPQAKKATRTYFKIYIKETGQAAGTFEALDQSYGIYRYADRKGRRYYSSSAVVSELEQYNEYRRQGKIEIKSQTESVMLVDNCVVDTRTYQIGINKMAKMGVTATRQTWGGADCL